MSSHLTIDHWISGHARFQPDKPAIHFKDQTLTYSQFEAAINKAAFQLHDRFAMVKGDRIAIYAFNCPEFFILTFAAARLGLIIVPLNWRLSATELGFILRDCDPRLLFVGADFINQANDIATVVPECKVLDLSIQDWDSAFGSRKEVPNGAVPGDALFLVYTSGTTGTPKGAVLTQAAMQCNAQMSLHAHNMTASDHLLNVLPLFHIGGIAILPLPGFSCGRNPHPARNIQSQTRNPRN